MKRIYLLLSCFSILVFLNQAYCANLIVGDPIPEIKINEKGMLFPDFKIENQKMVFMENGKIEYRPWESSSLKGKVTTIYHLAARNGMDEINKALIDEIIKAELPEKLPDSKYKTLTILNFDDAMWGTANIAESRFEKSQKKFPYALYVNDQKGVAQKAWKLKKKNSAVILIDKDGKILFFKEGKLNEEEIKEYLALIKKELK